MPKSEGDTSYEARLILASLSAPRFAGREALMRSARQGDELALQVLEMSPEERDFAIRKGTIAPGLMKVLAKHPVVVELERLRHTREEYRSKRDVLAERPQGNVLKRATLLAFRRALDEAGFRTAAHVHETIIHFVPAGEEGAKSTSRDVWASEAGLPAAYQRKAYRVVASKHVWSVSPEILKVPAGRRWDWKYLWLTPSLRVRQGRGTSLVEERIR